MQPQGYPQQQPPYPQPAVYTAQQLPVNGPYQPAYPQAPPVLTRPPPKKHSVPSCGCLVAVSIASLLCFLPFGLIVTGLSCVAMYKYKRYSQNSSVVTKIEAEALSVNAYRWFYSSISCGVVVIVMGLFFGLMFGLIYGTGWKNEFSSSFKWNLIKFIQHRIASNFSKILFWKTLFYTRNFNFIYFQKFDLKL